MKTFYSEVFPGHMHAEGGAMRFPPSHYATQARIADLKLPTRTFGTSSPEGLLFLEALGYPVPRKLFNASHPAYDPTMVRSVLLAFGVDDGGNTTADWVDVRFDRLLEPYRRRLTEATTPDELAAAWQAITTELDQHSTLSFLQAAGWSPALIELWAVTDNQENYLYSGMLEFFRDYMGQWWSQNSYYRYPNRSGIYAGLPEHGLSELANGTETLARAYYPLLQRELRFGHEVTAINHAEDHVELVYQVAGQEHREIFDYVIVTVPFLVLRHIAIDPPLSAPMRKAVREVYYTQSSKILLMFRERFWNHTSPVCRPADGHKGLADGLGGSSITDLPVRTIYYPTHPEDDNRGALLASYSWGQEAAAWGARTPEQRMADAARAVAQIHGPAALELLETSHSRIWQNEHLQGGGAFCHFLPGQLQALLPAMQQPQGVNGSQRLYFAGEHISYDHTWIQGALTSAVRAVLQLIDYINDNPTIPAYAAAADFFPSPEAMHHTSPVPGVNMSTVCTPGSQYTTITVAEFNTTVSSHRHPQAQLGRVLAGSLRVTVGGYTRTLAPGDSYVIPPNVFHSVVANSANVQFIEVFTPPKPECSAAQSQPLNLTAAHPDPAANLELLHAETAPRTQIRADAVLAGMGFGQLPLANTTDHARAFVVFNDHAVVADPSGAAVAVSVVNADQAFTVARSAVPTTELSLTNTLEHQGSYAAASVTRAADLQNTLLAHATAADPQVRAVAYLGLVSFLQLDYELVAGNVTTAGSLVNTTAVVVGAAAASDASYSPILHQLGATGSSPAVFFVAVLSSNASHTVTSLEQVQVGDIAMVARGMPTSTITAAAVKAYAAPDPHPRSKSTVHLPQSAVAGLSVVAGLVGLVAIAFIVRKLRAGSMYEEIQA